MRSFPNKKPSPHSGLLLVGTDSHTTAICAQMAEMYRLRLVQSLSGSLLSVLAHNAGDFGLLILDDSQEHSLDLLSAAKTLCPEVEVIVVTATRQMIHAAEAMERGALTILLKPCSFQEINRHSMPLLIGKIGRAHEDRVKRPQAADAPLYCDQCHRKLLGPSFAASPIEDRTRSEILNLEQVERRTICAAVRHAGGDNLKAARILGIGKTTLYRKLKQYGFGRTRVSPRDNGIRDGPIEQLSSLKREANAMLARMRELERRFNG